MYLSFYRLHDAPFNITPDPAFLYWTPGHQEAYAALTYGVDAQKGFIALIGEVGCGKTTVLRNYLDQSDRERIKAIYLINPEQDFDGVLQTMFHELALTIPEGGTGAAVETLHQYLLDSHKADQRVVLIVDEAQRMPAETMEHLRILSNLETAKAKLMQIVLCGQPELETLLARDDLRQIRERIAVRTHIGPLSPAQSLAYIRHRIECAKGHTDEIFTRSALKEIVRRTKGNPRLLNVLCDNSLIVGFANRKRPVTARMVQNASESIGQPYERGSRKRLALTAALFCIVAGVFIAGVKAKDWLPSLGKNYLVKTDNVVQKTIVSSELPVSTIPVGPVSEEPRNVEKANMAPAVTDMTKSVQNTMTEPISLPVKETDEKPSTTETVVTAGIPSVDIPPQTSTTAPITDGVVASQSKVTVPGNESSKAISLPDSTVAKPESKPESKPEAKPEATTVAEPVESEAKTSESILEKQVWVTVAPGDNIEKLIKRLNGQARPNLLKRLLALNPDLADANLIHPGQRMAIPIVSTDPSEAAGHEDSDVKAEK